MGVKIAVGLGLAIGLVAAIYSHNSPRESTVGNSAFSTVETHSRLVVLDPGMLEVLVHLDSTDSIVGRPDFSDKWTELSGLPTVGTGLTPNYEQIVRVQPDLILTHGSRGSVMSNLEQIAPTRNLPWLTISDVVEGIRSTATLLSLGEKAERLATDLETGLASTTGPDSPRVLVLLGPPTLTAPDLWYVKPHSIHGAALAAAGGINAITSELDGPPTISIEGMLQVDPEVVLVLISDMNTTEAQVELYREFWLRFPMLQAVKANRLGFMIGNTHFSTGPGVLEFKHALADKLAELESAP